MDIHKNARLTPILRGELAEKVILHGWTLKAAAAAFNVSPKTAAKWSRRFRQHGPSIMNDRSSRPHRLRQPTCLALVQRVEALRRERWTGVRIAQSTHLSRATVSRILRRLGLNHIRDLEPATAVVRYEHQAPGDLLHLDIKKLGRFQGVGHRIHGDRKHRSHLGWEYLHVAIDDHSRIAFSQVLPDQKGPTAARFLADAVAYYARLGITIRRTLTDNGPCYHSRAFARFCHQLEIKRRYTRPYTPRTNGKAERFIQTAIREWAYARAYLNSAIRAHELTTWIHLYNWHRPHASLANAPPISRSGLDRNNLLTQHN